MMSRSHATILFSPDYNNGCWILDVRSRNGVRLNTIHQGLGAFKPLSSGDVLEIGGIEMMIVLPEQEPLTIRETYLCRAGLLETDLPVPINDARAAPPNPSTARPSSSQSRSQPRQARGQQPIAPAPPNYKRPSTPPSARHTVNPTLKTSPSKASAAGSVILNTSDMDLSQDENKAIKPQSSYAQMITQAIMSTTEENLSLNGIYTYILTNYAYYRYQDMASWQVSLPVSVLIASGIS